MPYAVYVLRTEPIHGRLSIVMSWPTRKVFALLLAAFVAAGLSLSAVQASDMAVKMGMSSGMDMSGDGDCSGCPEQAPDGKGMTACPSVCVVPVVALPPQISSAEVAVSLPRLSPPLFPVLYGRHAPPDPYPPRPTDFA
ncbi:hypothetical protein D3227_34885 [Mesorhizobium waimense]|uniref:DUF2946 domain-containing protein n=1 Tax=Mesorhizobium waimense TaxID=1300307 RepID=A0A3A5K0F2_9HYPH|nr:hypothetical protein D3227_34885 [Mesorhizobium waimense]